MSEMPMKWYKFLIYFYLFYSAISSFVNGVSYFILADSVTDAAFIYMACGLALIVNGVLMIITRQMLARKRSKGPGMFILTTFIGAVVTVVGSLAGSMVENEMGVGLLTAIIIVILYGIYMIVNKIYFDKRKDVFTE